MSDSYSVRDPTYSIGQSSGSSSQISSNQAQNTSSTDAQSSGQATASGTSFIPTYSTTPILEEIANYARSQAPAVYQWGMDQYNNAGGDIDSLMRDALSYASPQRIALDMGTAESGVMQGAEAGRQSALRDLQSYGIDPSSGRYAALDMANRVQSAASAAGAGNQQRMADFAQGNAMRNQALASRLQNIQLGYGAPAAQNALLGTAMSLKYPPLGQQSQSQSTNQSTSVSRSQGTSAGRSSGSSNQQSSNVSGGGGGQSESQGGGGGGGGSRGSGSSGSRGSGSSGSGYGGSGSGYGSGGSGGTGDTTGDGGQPTGDNFGGTWGTGTYDYTGDYPGNAGYGVADFGQGYGGDYYGGVPTDFGYTGDAGSSTANLGSGGNVWLAGENIGADLAGFRELSGGVHGGPVERTGYAIGGPISQEATTGGFVSDDLSPSSGTETDDVDARLNAGEFVIPKDVSAWKGQEFFYKLMAQARQARAMASAESSSVGYGAS